VQRLNSEHSPVSIANHRTQRISGAPPSQSCENGENWHTAEAHRLISQYTVPRGFIARRSTVVGLLAFKDGPKRSASQYQRRDHKSREAEKGFDLFLPKHRTEMHIREVWSG